MAELDTYRVVPISIPPIHQPQVQPNYTDQQEAERRANPVMYNLGCFAVGLLVFFVVGLIGSQVPGAGAPAAVILLVSFFAIPFITNMVIRNAAVSENLRKIHAERQKATHEADQARENQQTFETTQKLRTLYQSQPANVASLTDLLQQGDNALDQADILFKERAYTPFWDAIEQALGRLKRFNDQVKLIDASAKEYYALLEGRQHTFPKFPVTRSHIPAPDNMVQRLSQAIGRAHRDFQFASIYEQRKTTSAVIAGFHSMQEAIDWLRQDIVGSIGTLQESLTSELQTISSNIEKAGTEQRDELKRLHDTLGAHANSSKQKADKDLEHQEFVEEALDNIQHRRKPRP